MKHPIQNIQWDGQGVIRFVENPIVRRLLDDGPFNMNQIATWDSVSDADRAQFAQLIGYSVSGFGDLGYADPLVVNEADRASGKMGDESSQATMEVPVDDETKRRYELMVQVWKRCAAADSAYATVDLILQLQALLDPVFEGGGSKPPQGTDDVEPEIVEAVIPKLTSAEIVALRDSPKELVPAPGSGKSIRIVDQRQHDVATRHPKD